MPRRTSCLSVRQFRISPWPTRPGARSDCRNSRAKCWCLRSFIQAAHCRIIASGCRTTWDACKKRFAQRMGRDLVLLSVTIDPAHDTPEVLARYAATWKADAKSRHFLTGPEPEVERVCRRFGVNFWPDEGTLTHSLHTIVVDRRVS
ncbi:MAG TPA: SCO family protein [Bryobacteraceae bacterium]|nr:SCO family protein [Bryobacteraceae bacterium]